MPVLEIEDNVFWVGSVDWELRDFHGYSLARKGTTYNAFLVMDEKPTLFDTVAGKHSEEFFKNIQELINPEEIDSIVVNHVEPDHSGCLTQAVERIKPKKIYCSSMGRQFMLSHYHQKDWPYEVVKTGDSISLGKKTVHFIELKMLHWPDNMGCFFEQDKLLLSSDAFGHNWATSERFDDQVDFNEVLFHLAHYFANIILPYSGSVLTAIEKIESLGWDVQMIAPDHGVIFRSRVADVIQAYKDFALQKAKAVIFYDTMWKSTQKMAHAIAEGLRQECISVKLFFMKTCHHSDVMAEVLDAQAVIVGSPIHNQGVLPFIAGMLRYMEGLKPQGKLAAAFGSYGWGKESINALIKNLEKMNMDVIGSVRVQNMPTDDVLSECVALGKTVAEAIKQRQR